MDGATPLAGVVLEEGVVLDVGVVLDDGVEAVQDNVARFAKRFVTEAT